MSGHSKWSKVKHQKATTDVVKAQAFTKASHAIMIAVREGGGIGDPNLNFRLRLAIEKAHAVNMPKENIARAIERGGGEGAGSIEQIVYEVYGPGGVAFLVDVMTDNRQRTVSAVKNVLDRHGGSLASPGAVSYMFRRTGILTTLKPGKTLDHIMEAAIAAGADDVVETEDVYEVYCDVAHMASVKEKLERSGLTIDNAEIIERPTTTLAIAEEVRTTVENLESQLSELDDVHRVYTNVD